MQPVYFPYTLIEDSQMKALGHFFEKVAVYQVMAPAVPRCMQAWQEEGRLDIRLPMQRHERELAAILNDYQTWARQHQGGDLSFFKVKGDAVPFFNDTSVAQIRRDIRQKSQPAAVGSEKAPINLYPGVFLQMAQDLDAKSREVTGDLESQVRNEQALMEAIKGDAPTEAASGRSPVVSPDDSYRYMIPARVAAWSRLMAADRLESPLLITTHQGVLEALGEKAAKADREAVFLQTVSAVSDEAGPMTSFCRALMAWLETLATTAWDHGRQQTPVFRHAAGPSDSAFKLSLHLFPGVGPHELLGVDLNAGAGTGPDIQWQSQAIVNTVVGIVAT